MKYYGRDKDLTLTCWGQGDQVLGNELVCVLFHLPLVVHEANHSSRKLAFGTRWARCIVMLANTFTDHGQSTDNCYVTETGLYKAPSKQQPQASLLQLLVY